MQLASIRQGVLRFTQPRTSQILSQLLYFSQPAVAIRSDNVHFRKELINAAKIRLDGWIDSLHFNTANLCSRCGKYNWKIPAGADDYRPRDNLDFNGEQNDSGTVPDNPEATEDRETPPTPCWLAPKLPSGSLFDLLTSATCPICTLVLHLLSPLPVKSFLTWAMDQPLAKLREYRYALLYREGERIEVKKQLQPSQAYIRAGFIASYSQDSLEHIHMVWQACGLSGTRYLNTSLAQSSEIDYELLYSLGSRGVISSTRVALGIDSLWTRRRKFA